VEAEPSLSRVKELILGSRREDALAMLAGLPESQVEDVPFLEELGHIFMARQDFDAAGSVYRRWVMCEPGNAKAFNSLGAALVSGGWLDAALPALQMAVSNDPDKAVYHLNLAKLYMVRNQWEEANAMLVNMAHRFPEQRDKLSELWAQFPDTMETPEREKLP
jgi:Flp pilus assembly protein TadD